MRASALATDIREVPFSRRGSWLALSPVVGLHRVADHVHLVDHRQGMHPVLRFVPIGADAVAAGPALLAWTGDGVVEAVFEGPDVVRLRGRGPGMRVEVASPTLTPFTGCYLVPDPVDGTAQVCSYETGLRYRLEVLAGAAQVLGAEALGTAERAVVVAPGDWELRIAASGSGAPARGGVPPFDEVAAAAAAELDAFAAPFGDGAAAAKAAAVIWAATVAPAGFVGREAVLMSKHWMDKVWSWDHCFTALALAPVWPELALGQFLLPFDHQDADGALPDSVTHAEVLRNFVKPPVHGWAFRRLRERLARPLTAGELTRVHDALAAWSRYWLEVRRPAGGAVPWYGHGNDSGWDNATVFDDGGLVASPDLAALLAVQLGVLADLADELSLPSAGWRRERRALLDALLGTWDGRRFAAIRPAGTRVASRSLLTLVPLVAATDLPPDVVAGLVATLAEHRTAWGLATEPPDSPAYDPDGYWRGPIWAPPTVLIEDGLRAAGFTSEAAALRDDFLRLTARGGFAENFDAVTGEGLRDRAYTWTAAAHLVLDRAGTLALEPETSR